MIEKTRALMLRGIPYSNTSAILSWLTCDDRHLVTIVKGAHRPKSQFMGQYDLFYTCEILYYPPTRPGMAILRECSPIATRTALRDDWRAVAAAAHLSELIRQACLHDAVHEGAFALLEDALEALLAGSSPLDIALWGELRLLCLLGLEPRLARCASCATPLSAHHPAQVFSHARGGLLCPSCARSPRRPGDDPIRMTAPTIELLLRWMRVTRARDASLAPAGLGEARSAARTLGDFLSWHIDAPRRERDIALRLAATTPNTGHVAMRPLPPSREPLRRP